MIGRKMMRGLGILMIMCCAVAALAAPPTTINYQGYLKDSSSGLPISASIPMSFSLYSSGTGGSPLWSETVPVEVNNGIYSVTLGAASPMSPSLFSSPLYLGITINQESAEQAPRIPLTSVPYALQAGCVPGDGVECYTGPPATRNNTPCKPGKRICTSEGTWGPCTAETLPQTETVNDIDDDCDGIVDNIACSIDADCSASQFCDSSQKCLPKLPNGTSCTREAQCLVHCTNGSCSDLLGCTTAADCGTATACSSYTCSNNVCGTLFNPYEELIADQIAGDCRSRVCDGSGNIINVGNDADLPASDGNDCTLESCSNGSPQYLPATTGTTCSSGFCNGSGVCVECLSGYHCPSGVCNIYSGICAQPTCMDGVKNGSETSIDCGGAACSPCQVGESCSVNQDCVSGACSGGICKSQTGAACVSDNQCATGFCTDGVCCQSRCGGICEKCNQAGRLGFCDPVALATDPDNECADQGVASCGTSGYCSGIRSCGYYSAGTVAADASCSNGSFTAQSTCDGLGTVVPGEKVSCSPYICASGTACNASCTMDADCASGYFCNGSMQCTARLAQGVACSTSNQCISGFCTDGVCCDSACSGSCMACSAAKNGSVSGSCSDIPAGTDPDNECADAATCNGAGVCQ